MRRFHLAICFSAALLLVAAGCGHKKEETSTQAAQVLEQSFKTADPQVQQAVTTASTAIKTAATATDVNVKRENYIQALRPVTVVASQPTLSREQVQAIQKVYLQVQQAAAKNPTLVNQDLYNAQAALAKKLHKAGVLP